MTCIHSNANLYPTELPIRSVGCAECFMLLHNHIERLFEKSGYLGGYQRAFVTLFGRDIESFTATMILYLDQLKLQMDKTDFSERSCTAAFGVVIKQLHAFIDSRFTMEYDHDSHLTSKWFVDHTGLEVDAFRITLLQITRSVKESIKERAHLLSTNETAAAERSFIVAPDTLFAPEVDASHQQVTKQHPASEGHASDYDKDPDQDLPTYDSCPLEETDIDVTSNSIYTNPVWENSDQDTTIGDVSNPLVSNELTKLNETIDIHVFRELSDRFSQLEKHCISLEIAMQQNEEQFLINQPRVNSELPELREYFMINELKAQIETKDQTINRLKQHIDVMHAKCSNLKVIATHDNNIDSKTYAKVVHKVKVLHNENESLERHRKTLNEFIKEQISKTVAHTKSLIANNDKVTNVLQKKILEITTLKRDLCKLTMNDVNTKFDKSSTVGAPLDMSHRKPRSTRQLSAFSTNRSKFNKSRCDLCWIVNTLNLC
jgi:hypothetical protein